MPCQHDPKKKVYLHLAEPHQQPKEIRDGACGRYAVLQDGTSRFIYKDYLAEYYLLP